MGATIVGTDIDPRAIGLARQHARAAGVETQIHFQVQSFADLASRKEHGCLIANPPYGERMSERAAVAALYRSMPDVLRHLKTWSIYILTAWPDFEKLLGQTADRRRKLYNGRIACTYYQFHGPDPRKPEAAPAPVFGGVSVKGREQAEMFMARLRKREHHLRRWAQREGIGCFRLYDRDIPEIPLVVDRYGDCLHVREYDRPHARTPAEHADWIDLMARSAGDALGVRHEFVFVKHRARQRGLAPHEPLGDENRVFEVLEGGLRFEVNLSDYADTGLFLDHRQTRARVRADADGKRFLNLFGHTGAFTVCAAAGGARRTTTVDPSNTHLAWAERNMRANGFVGAAHRYMRADALAFLREHRPGLQYDLAVVDPPTLASNFSSHRMTTEDWEVQREHASLLTQVLALTAPGGVIYFATHLRSFKLDQAGIAAAAITEISHETVPPDFRNRRIHRCWRMVKNA
jgi:23S rRNA (guanine2445-N2)-methyltransferase / 23S rRNA (guanine2069-N7)-methyltransferase